MLFVQKKTFWLRKKSGWCHLGDVCFVKAWAEKKQCKLLSTYSQASSKKRATMSLDPVVSQEHLAQQMKNTSSLLPFGIRRWSGRHGRVAAKIPRHRNKASNKPRLFGRHLFQHSIFGFVTLSWTDLVHAVQLQCVWPKTTMDFGFQTLLAPSLFHNVLYSRNYS